MSKLKYDYGHMAIIYRAVGQDGMVYIGASKRSELKPRISEHKSNAKNRYNDFQKTILKFGIKYFKFEIIETCHNSIRFSREKFWISHYKAQGICLNNSDGGQGPNGVKRPDFCKKQAGLQMKSFWDNDRQGMLENVNAHKTKEYQSWAGKMGGAAKAAKYCKPFEVIDKSSGKSLGIFKTKKDLAKRLDLSESTAGRYFSGKLKKGRELYEFVWK